MSETCRTVTCHDHQLCYAVRVTVFESRDSSVTNQQACAAISQTSSADTGLSVVNRKSPKISKKFLDQLSTKFQSRPGPLTFTEKKNVWGC
jgi:hypothetical protein